MAAAATSRPTLLHRSDLLRWSVAVLKSLVARCGFVSWMAEPMYDTEKASGIFDALNIVGLDAPRTLTAFRRRQGILPTPALKLFDELRHLTGGLASR